MTCIVHYFAPNNKGELLFKSYQIVNMTDQVRQRILDRLSDESVLLIECGHLTRTRTWGKFLENKPFVRKQILKFKMMLVCKKDSFAEEHLETIEREKLWKHVLSYSFLRKF